MSTMMLEPEDEEEASRRHGHESANAATPPRLTTRRKRFAFVACFLIVFTSQLLGALMASPVLRLFEMSACRDYYLKNDPSKVGRDGNVDEDLCKVAPVQAELVFIHSTLYFITSAIALTVTIPFGIVADKYGRKLVLGLNASAEVAFFILIGMIGYFYNIFPTRAYIFTALLQFLGGGGKVVSAIIYSVIADIATPEERIRLFYYLEIAEYSTQLLAPGLSAMLMGLGLWVPFGTGVAVAAIALGFVLCLPDTMPREKARKGGFWLSDDGQARAAGGNFEQRSSRIPNRDPSELEVLLERRSSTEGKGPYFDRLYQAVVDWIPHPFAKLKPGSESQLLVQFAVLFIWSIAWSSNLLLQQYSSKKIGWTIAQSSYIISFKALINILLFSFLLPFIRQTFAARGSAGTDRQVEMFIARTSAFLLAVGSGLIGLSTETVAFLGSLAIFALGDGFKITLQAYMITLIDPSAVAQLCTWMALGNTAGLTVGRPLMMQLFREGLAIDGQGLGLPYFSAMSIYLCAALLLWFPCQQSPDPVKEDEEDEEEIEEESRIRNSEVYSN